jgi:ribonucleoside-diphosphate reductase beta chain
MMETVQNSHSQALQERKLYDVHAPNASTGIINGQSSNVLNWDDVRFPWAYPMYKNMLANFWTPFEINMSSDIKQYPMLSDDEQEAFNKIIGLLAFLDSVQTDYSSRVAQYLTDSSLSALMTTLAFQEVVHNQSYSYVLSSVVNKQKQDEIFEYWKHDQVLRERNDFIAEGYERFVSNPTPQTFMESIVYDVILEGLNFYSGFSFFYNLARNQKMVSTSTMINYINRDEQLHVNLFSHIFKELLREHPELDTEETRRFVQDTFVQAAELEITYRLAPEQHQIGQLPVGRYASQRHKRRER